MYSKTKLGYGCQQEDKMNKELIINIALEVDREISAIIDRMSKKYMSKPSDCCLFNLAVVAVATGIIRTTAKVHSTLEYHEGNRNFNKTKEMLLDVSRKIADLDPESLHKEVKKEYEESKKGASTFSSN